jgi:hypothetical protein
VPAEAWGYELLTALPGSPSSLRVPGLASAAPACIRLTSGLRQTFFDTGFPDI